MARSPHKAKQMKALITQNIIYCITGVHCKIQWVLTQSYHPVISNYPANLEIPA